MSFKNKQKSFLTLLLRLVDEGDDSVVPMLFTILIRSLVLTMQLQHYVKISGCQSTSYFYELGSNTNKLHGCSASEIL